MLANHGMFTIISTGPDDPSRVVSVFPLKQTDFNRKVANNCKFFSLPYNGGYERLMTERKPLVVTYTLI